jgi:hypothetical protein
VADCHTGNENERATLVRLLLSFPAALVTGSKTPGRDGRGRVGGRLKGLSSQAEATAMAALTKSRIRRGRMAQAEANGVLKTTAVLFWIRIENNSKFRAR